VSTRARVGWKVISLPVAMASSPAMRRLFILLMAAYTKQMVRDRLIEHKAYITRYGQDMPEILNWTWRANDTYVR
jgi:phosphoketolase